MKKVVYLPLDERPCNLKYPRKLAEMTDISLVTPEKAILGRKKEPANPEEIQKWLLNESIDAEYLILSIDMLVYGGIVPSRIHNLSFEECTNRLKVIKEIKKENPKITIYAFNLIMRVPNNETDEEEPYYYKWYGKKIFRYSWLMDKKERSGLTCEERKEYSDIVNAVPNETLEDFIQRRVINTQVNHYVLSLVNENIIKGLTIPLDDNSKYGFSAKEQQQLVFRVEELDLIHRVLIYPGADDLGCSLFSKVFCEIKKYTPEIYVRYSSSIGPFMKPKYEDRSLNESIKSQVIAAGAVITDHSYETQNVLMVNSPATEQLKMAEQVPFTERDHTYQSEVNYREFIEAIKMYIRKGKAVSIADVAVCNGADRYLMKLLYNNQLLGNLTSYAGWNTSGNTLGTVLAHKIIYSYNRKHSPDAEINRSSYKFYYQRLIEDWGYQAVVRQDIVENVLPEVEAGYYNLKHVQKKIESIITQRLTDFISQYLNNNVDRGLSIEHVKLPWERMFEIDFDVNLQ